MIIIRCPDCGAFVDECYYEELPAEFDCAICGCTWTEESEEESDEESESGEIEWENEGGRDESY